MALVSNLLSSNYLENTVKVHTSLRRRVPVKFKTIKWGNYSYFQQVAILVAPTNWWDDYRFEGKRYYCIYNNQDTVPTDFSSNKGLLSIDFATRGSDNNSTHFVNVPWDENKWQLHLLALIRYSFALDFEVPTYLSTNRQDPITQIQCCTPSINICTVQK